MLRLMAQHAKRRTDFAVLVAQPHERVLHAPLARRDGLRRPS
jgi:hypothetical protein